MKQLLFGPLAEYYFQLERRDQRLDSDIRSLHQIFQASHAQTAPAGAQARLQVLDLGCGSGEHVHALARLGYTCYGIDQSATMLDIARRRAAPTTQTSGRSASTEGSSNFVQGDFRQLPWQDQFDGAFCLFGGFNYLVQPRDLQLALRSTYLALKSGALLLVEFWQREPYDGLPYQLTTAWQELGRKDIQHNPQLQSKLPVAFQIRRRRRLQRAQDEYGQLLQIHYEYALQSVPGLPDGSYQEEHCFRLLDYAELLKYCRQAGFDLYERRSRLDLPGMRANSGSLILILKKST